MPIATCWLRMYVFFMLSFCAVGPRGSPKVPRLSDARTRPSTALIPTINVTGRSHEFWRYVVSGGEGECKHTRPPFRRGPRGWAAAELAEEQWLGRGWVWLG